MECSLRCFPEERIKNLSRRVDFCQPTDEFLSTIIRARFPEEWCFMGHDAMTWSPVFSSAPHSQAADRAIPHLNIVVRKRLMPFRML